MKHAAGNPDELKEQFWKALADSPFLFLQLDGQSSTASADEPAARQGCEQFDLVLHAYQERFCQARPRDGHFREQGPRGLCALCWHADPRDQQGAVRPVLEQFRRAWYEGGKDDPNILFLRMDLGDAEIWNGDLGLLTTAKMALGKTVVDEAEEKHAKSVDL
jgi:hypothetical protein